MRHLRFHFQAKGRCFAHIARHREASTRADVTRGEDSSELQRGNKETKQANNEMCRGMSFEQTNTQTTKQTSKQANKQRNNQTNKQASKQTINACGGNKQTRLARGISESPFGSLGSFGVVPLVRICWLSGRSPWGGEISRSCLLKFLIQVTSELNDNPFEELQVFALKDLVPRGCPPGPLALKL